MAARPKLKVPTASIMIKKSGVQIPCLRRNASAMRGENSTPAAPPIRRYPFDSLSASTARQRYHAAAVRCGCQRAPKRAKTSGAGNCRLR